MNPTHIILHHSLTADGETVSWQAIRRYHMQELGWLDCGYHYGIELIGKEYEILKGRLDNEAGAHCLGFNDKAIGICNVGNFDIHAPSDILFNKLARFCRSLMDIYGLKSDCVLGHRETYALLGKPQAKTCPGNFFDMTKFRQMI